MTIPMVNEFIYLTNVLAEQINQPPVPTARRVATVTARGNLSI